MSSLVSTADQLSPSLPLCCLFSCRTKHLSSESSLLLHGARTSSYSFQIPSILLTPSVDLNIFSRASCLFVGVIVSKRHTAAGSLPSCRLPFHSCCYSKNATKHFVCVQIIFTWASSLISWQTHSPFRVPTWCIFVQTHLWFCGFVGKCNISVCIAHFCALESAALGQIIHFILFFCFIKGKQFLD